MTTNTTIVLLILVSIATAVLVGAAIKSAYRSGKKYAYQDVLEIVTRQHQQHLDDNASGTPVYQQLARDFPKTAIALVTPIQDALVATFEWEHDESLDVALVSAEAVDRWKREQS